jgi:hypothetical protein
MSEPEPKPRKRGKTPTAEKVERRLVEQWGAIRRRPQYREAWKTAQEAQLALSALEVPLSSYEPGATPSGLRPKRRPVAIDQLRAQLAHAMATLESFGIDADPDNPTPVQLLDLLTPTHTNYSIDTQQVISGAYLLCETPWARDWSKGRDAVLVLDRDPQVPLEEVRAGVEHIIKFRAHHWRKARRILGDIPVRSVSLIGPGDPGWEPVWEMLVAIGAEPAPVLLIDPMMPLGQLRAEIDAALTAWGRKRPRAKNRWRHTISRDLQAFDVIQEHLAKTGEVLTYEAVARRLGCSEDQARQSVVRARALIGAPTSTITFEGHQATCTEGCRAKALCPVGDRLLNIDAGGAQQELLPHDLERIDSAMAAKRWSAAWRD